MSQQFSCVKCNKIFLKKAGYMSHQKRKTPCAPTQSPANTPHCVSTATATATTINLNSVINTFKDLYEFLQTYSATSIIGWLSDRWEGKDKQESLLRLFAGLGLIEKLNKYKTGIGNALEVSNL